MVTKVVIRVLCGAIAGPALYAIARYRYILTQVSHDNLPWEELMAASILFGLFLGITTPGLPWRSDDR